MAKEKKQFFLRIWNADKNETENVPFDTSEIDWMMEEEMIDNDMIGFAMNDADAFERALLHMTESNRAWKYSEFIDLYLGLTDKPLIIEA